MTAPIREFLQHLKLAREKATQGRWEYDRDGDMICTLEEHESLALEYHIADMRGFGANLPIEENADLICLAANNITKLADMCEVLLTEMEKLAKLREVEMDVDHGYWGNSDDSFRHGCDVAESIIGKNARAAIQRAQLIAEGKNENL